MSRRTPFPRRLNRREADALVAVIDALAERAFGDPLAPAVLHAQVVQATVVSGCGCGCATISLDASVSDAVPGVDDIVLLTSAGQGDQPWDVSIRDGAGRHLGFLNVTTVDGRLAGMEVYTAGEMIREIPHPSDLYLADGSPLADARQVS